MHIYTRYSCYELPDTLVAYYGALLVYWNYFRAFRLVETLLTIDERAVENRETKDTALAVCFARSPVLKLFFRNHAPKQYGPIFLSGTIIYFLSEIKLLFWKNVG